MQAFIALQLRYVLYNQSAYVSVQPDHFLVRLQTPYTQYMGVTRPQNCTIQWDYESSTSSNREPVFSYVVGIPGTMLRVNISLY